MARRQSRFVKTAAFFSLAGVAFYNNWLLAIFLNWPAAKAGATTSELGALGQPHYMLFRLLDAAAGLFFIIGLPAMCAHASNRCGKILLGTLVGVLGLSTIAESLLFPLQCSSALSLSCAMAENAGSVSWAHQFHIYESVISYGIIALLPAVIYLLSRRKATLAPIKKLSIAVIVYMAVWFLESYYRDLRHARSYGFEQRLFIVLFSTWYISAIRPYMKIN